MSSDPSLEGQTSNSGIKYGKRHDISYRAGLMMQVLGLGGLAVLYPLENAFFTAGIMLFELGALVSAVYLLVWMRWVRKFILGSIIIGLALQAAAQVYAPEQYAGAVIITGIGLVCVGAAGMAGKEAYCFAYREGWMLMWLYPAVILTNLTGLGSRVFNALAFSALFILMLFLVGKKLKQPLLAPCASGAGGQPEPKA